MHPSSLRHLGPHYSQSTSFTQLPLILKTEITVFLMFCSTKLKMSKKIWAKFKNCRLCCFFLFGGTLLSLIPWINADKSSRCETQYTTFLGILLTVYYGLDIGVTSVTGLESPKVCKHVCSYQLINSICVFSMEAHQYPNWNYLVRVSIHHLHLPGRHTI